jgi:hypothetical protein
VGSAKDQARNVMVGAAGEGHAVSTTEAGTTYEGDIRGILGARAFCPIPGPT